MKEKTCGFINQRWFFTISIMNAGRAIKMFVQRVLIVKVDL